MRCLIHTLLFVLVLCTPNAFATGLLDLMDPSTQAIVRACDTGYSDVVAQANSRYSLNLGVNPTVRLQTPLASAFIICQNAAKNGKPRPNPSQIASEAVVYVYGQVLNLNDAKSITANLVLRDSSEQVSDEFPRTKGDRIALEPDWERKCENNQCLWNGRNILHFQVTNELRTKLRQADVRLEIQITRQGQMVPVAVPASLSATTPSTPLDTTFGQHGLVRTEFVSGNATAYASTLQVDGKVIAAGVSGLENSYSFALARYDASGELDKRFGIDGTLEERPVQGGYLFDLDVQADGKIIAAGYGLNVVSPSSAGDVAIVRFTRTGSIDPTFGTRGLTGANISNYDLVQQVKIQPDGKILIAGYSQTSDGWTIFLGRLTPDGQGNTTFGQGGLVLTQLGSLGLAYGMALQPDGKIVLVGQDGSVGNADTSVAVLRYLPDGTLDQNFGRDGRTITPVGPKSESAFRVAIQNDGNIVIAGQTSDGQKNSFLLLRYTNDGKLDQSFGNNGRVITGFNFDAGAVDLGIRKDGKIIAVGYVGEKGNYNFAFARYLANGTLDPSFGIEGRWVQAVGGDASTTSLELMPDDGVIVTGSSGVGTLRQFVLCRLLP
jgi:uncharacterized delta-60 repeat protein